MRAKVLEDGPARRFAVILETGDEAVSALLDFARDNGVDAASFTAIGGFQDATLAYFDVASREYRDIPVHEQVEVLCLTGDVTLAADDHSPTVHAHVVVGLPDGSTRGGHVRHALVRPTLEVMLVESPPHLRRRWDDKVGLALVDLGVA